MSSLIKSGNTSIVIAEGVPERRNNTFCQGCGKDDVTLQRCSKCHIATYCGVSCQKKDWPVHKKQCPLLTNRDLSLDEKAKQEADSIQSQSLVIDYVNPKKTRSIAKHAADGHPAHQMNKSIKMLLRHLGLDAKTAQISVADKDLQGMYGRCTFNVDLVISQKGGKRIDGWNIFEGKWFVEAEAHSVWQPPNENIYVNVTPTSDNRQYSCMFVPDPSVLALAPFTKKLRPNVLYWK